MNLAHVAAERAARESYGRLLAYLAARCGDVAEAEDALADAFAAGLERWPREGVPTVPAAWLLVAARRRLTDRQRRAVRGADVATRLERSLDQMPVDGDDADAIPDQRLAMMFACAHPAIDASIRGPLLLQLVLGFDAARIASAFLVSPAAMSQRLVRAKRKIAAAGIALTEPPAQERSARLDAVLAAIYATFANGWDDPANVDGRTADFVAEALWLGRFVVTTCPDEPEALGLLALMLHANARSAARRDANGDYVPRDQQNPALWDAVAIDEAEALLARASRARRIGRFQLEAAIQSAYAVRRFHRDPDAHAIALLYDALLTLTGSPVIALNRAVVIAALRGPDAALTDLVAIDGDPRMKEYQPYWAARADLLARAGRMEEADRAYTLAIGFTIDPASRRFLIAQRAALTDPDHADRR